MAGSGLSGQHFKGFGALRDAALDANTSPAAEAYKKFVGSYGTGTDYLMNTGGNGVMPYSDFRRMFSAFGLNTPQDGGGGGTNPPTPPPNGDGGNNQEGCINGICPMPGLPAYSQPPSNWRNQLPGMRGTPMEPLYQYDPSFGLGLGTQAAGTPNWQAMLANLFQQYNPTQQ